MQLYNDYNSYLRRKFGTKVYRIGLDAGFSCPNRDGSKGVAGCIYCSDEGSRSSYTDRKETVQQQLSKRISLLKTKYGAKKFIAYFQAFTNTHAPVDKLKKIYDTILPFREVVGLSIGTRPDAVDRKKIELIAGYRRRYDTWIEFGLQSVHNKTLAAIGRGHDFSDFVKAAILAKGSGIKISVHVILGLPGETRDHIIQTARTLADMGIDGIKIHLLHVLRSSPLEKTYAQGKLRLLEQDEYAGLVCDFLECLPKDVVVQRLTGEGSRQNHIAPAWALDKTGTINLIGEMLKKRGSYQGAKYGSRPLSARSSK